MQRVLTALEMQASDKYTIDVLGISETELINRAGEALASVVTSLFKTGRVLFLIGKGNNGKDGEKAYEILSSVHGFNVDKIYAFNPDFSIFNKNFDILIDCIFGVGLNKEIIGEYLNVIEKANQVNAVKISCDIPSGINADNGLVMGAAFKADYTVCIQEYKLGHFLNDGIDYCGKLIKKDIGIAVFGDNYVSISEDKDVKEIFPLIKRNTNKGNNGKVAVFGGSKDYFGSVLLSVNALTALKMGVGYSFLTIPESLFSDYAGKNPEVIIKRVKDDNGNIIFDKNLVNSLLDCDSIAFGMGVGISESIYETAAYLLKNYKNTLVLDADALNSVAKFGIGILKEKSCKVILTPHLKEFSRLSGYSMGEIKSNGIVLAKRFAMEYGVVLLLKSAVSIITNGEEVYLNTTGNCGLSKAGSGDVLSGIVAGLSSRTKDALFSAICSSYILGKAGEESALENCEITITASDVVNSLSKVISRLIKN